MNLVGYKPPGKGKTVKTFDTKNFMFNTVR